MAGSNLERPIVVKRVKKVVGGHHGGQWKIAYADFVTAMMAFFLLMWLIGSTTKGDLEGISEYFRTPLKVALQGGSGSGDASHVIKGGGQDLSRSAGQVKRGDLPPKEAIINLKAAEAERARRELLKLKELKGRLQSIIEANPRLSPYQQQIRLDMTQEGLRIQIVDEQSRPMFSVGSAELLPHTRDILQAIGQSLNDVENRITISGHTDTRPYASGERGYSNWELSADRANASRRQLIAGGMQDSKIFRVIGLASSLPMSGVEPHDEINRRISIIVMNKKTEEELLKESPAEPENEAGAGLDGAPAAAAGAGATPDPSAADGGRPASQTQVPVRSPG